MRPSADPGVSAIASWLVQTDVTAVRRVVRAARPAVTTHAPPASLPSFSRRQGRRVMSSIRRTRVRCLVPIALLILCSGMAVGAECAHAQQDESLRPGEIPFFYQLSRIPRVIATYARLSLSRQQVARDLLSQPITPEMVSRAHVTCIEAYKAARAAHENTQYRKAGLKYPDPVLNLFEEYIGKSRASIIQCPYALDHGGTQDPFRVGRALELVNAAIRYAEIAVVLMP